MELILVALGVGGIAFGLGVITGIIAGTSLVVKILDRFMR